MKIILSPIASNRTTQVSVSGLVITIDGTPIDLSVIPVGGVAEPDADSPFVGNVTRDEVTVKYYYASAKAEPDQSKDWADYTFELTEGEVPSPIVWKPEVIEEVIAEEIEVQDV
jgi:hypothetical protein